MPHIQVYTGLSCPYCRMAKQLLQQLGVRDIEEINVDENPDKYAEMQERTGKRSVPQIFIGETYVGGFTDLYALHQKGGVLPLLSE